MHKISRLISDQWFEDRNYATSKRLKALNRIKIVSRRKSNNIRPGKGIVMPWS